MIYRKNVKTLLALTCGLFALPLGATDHPPTNDSYTNALPLSLGTTTGTTLGATPDIPYKCQSLSEEMVPDVWFIKTTEEPPNTPPLFAEVFAADFDPVLSLHGIDPEEGGPQFDRGCADPASSDVLALALVGRELIRVGSLDGASGPFELRVGHGGTLSGRVTSAATGAPLAGVRVELFTYRGIDPRGDTSAATVTDADGNYRFADLQPTTYQVYTQNDQGFIDEIWDGTDGVPCTTDCSFRYSDVLVPVHVGEETAAIDFPLEVGGAIVGTAVDARTGKPIPNVEVVVQNLRDSFVARDKSDAQGRFALDGLVADNYYAVATSSSHADVLYPDLPCPDGNCLYREGTPIVVAPSATVRIEFALARGGAISGRVTHASTGLPVPESAQVGVVVLDENGFTVTGSSLAAEGTYTLGGLDPGSYYLKTTSTQFLDEIYPGSPCLRFTCGHHICPVFPTCTPGDLIEVGPDQLVPGIDLAINRLGAISGTVRASTSGEGLANIQIQAVRQRTGDRFGTVTDAAGNYRIAGLLPGDYFLLSSNTPDPYGVNWLSEVYGGQHCAAFSYCDPTSGEAVPVALETDVTGIDFALDHGGELLGRVADHASGMPVSGAWIYFHLEGEPYPVGYSSSDSTGWFRSNPLLPGTYTAEAGAFGYEGQVYCAGASCPPGGTPIAVDLGAKISGIDFQLQRQGSIAGTVRTAATGATLAFAGVQVLDQNGGQVAGAITDMQGQYLVAGLAPGTYIVVADMYPNFLREIYADVLCSRFCDPQLGTPIVVARGAAVTGIDFTLDAAASFSGRMVDAATGLPLAFGQVEVRNAEGISVSWAYTAENGTFTAAGLLAGRYFALATAHLHEAQVYANRSCSFPHCDVLAGTPIEVSAGGNVQGIDFALEPWGKVTGRVVDADGKPLQGVGVEFTSAPGFANWAYTDAAGRYEIPVPTGTLHAVAHGYPGYEDELYHEISCRHDCDPSVGTPLEVAVGQVISGVDFTLDPLGEVRGSVTWEGTGDPVSLGLVQFWTPAGVLVSTLGTNFRGVYQIPLPAGTYYATFYADGYLGKLYDGLACPSSGGSVPCDFTGATPIEVRAGEVTANIDFTTRRTVGISGRVSSAAGEGAAGEGLPRVVVDFWNSSGGLVASAFTSAGGIYSLNLEAGTYFASTDNLYGAPDQVYAGIACPEGSAFTGRCDPTRGTPIVVPVGEAVTGIDFVLDNINEEACVPGPNTLCLNQGRFRVEVLWEDFAQQTGRGEAVPLTDETGYFWFFSENNVELVVKVLNGCALPSHHFWVFAGGLTNVGTKLVVIDTWTGARQEYRNLPRAAFQPVQDTRAFATCEATRSLGLAEQENRLRVLARLDQLQDAARVPSQPPRTTPPTTACVPSSIALCLSQRRFKVEATYRTPDGQSGAAQAVPLTGDTGYFWFFNQRNVEMVTKVLNACDLAPFHRFWVFAAGLTNVEVTLTVTDTESGQIETYHNPQSMPFAPIQDLRSFDRCL